MTVRLLLFLSVCFSQADAVSDFSVRGTVASDETASPLPTPLPHTVVNLYNRSDSLVSSAVATDDGSFRLHAPHPGTYHLTAYLIGYEEFSLSIRVDDEETVVRIRLIPKAIPMEGVEVRGERPHVSLEWSASSFVRVIERDEIVQGNRTWEEVLDETAGVQTTSYGGLGAFSTVSIRGSTSEQVAVYVDGIPWNESRGGGVNLAEIPLGSVERIEIHRGSAPLNFGGQALGGVINIITRPGSFVNGGSVKFSLGSFGTATGLAGGTMTMGAYRLDGSLSYQGSRNDFAFLDDNGTGFNESDDAITERKNNGFVSRSLIGGLQRDLGESLYLDVRLNLLSVRQGLPGISNNQALGTNLRSNSRTVSAALSGRRPFLGFISPTINLAMRSSRSHYRDPEGEIGLGRQDNDDRTELSGGEAGVVLGKSAGLSSRLSGGVWRERFEPSNRLLPDAAARESDRTRQMLSVDLRFRPEADYFSVFGGAVRELVEDHFTSANPLNPSLALPSVDSFTAMNAWRLGASVSPTKWLKVKTNRAFYFRPPSFHELFGDRGPVTGNPDLTPESGTNSDIGIQLTYRQNKNFGGRLELTRFRHRSTDLILYIHNAQRVSKAVNIGQAEVKGSELSGEVTLFGRWSTRLSLTVQDPRDRSDVSYWRDKMLPNRPGRQGFIRNSLKLGRVSLTYDFLLEEDQYQDRANLKPIAAKEIHNMGIAWQITPGYRISLEAKNISDNRIADHWGYPLPGRSYFVSFQWRQAGNDGAVE